MWNKKVIKPFLIFYISLLLLASYFMIPTVTSLYYYAWGKHLAWSYFDGPPMIAFFFYISHAIFGNTFFSINIVGFFCLIVSAFYIYKTGCLLQDKRTGFISALIWAALPTTTESVFVRVLYDAPLNLFTVLSIYCFARYIKQKRTIDIYRTAVFIGAMILSKYTAAVSVIGILFYIVFSNQKQLFKNVHFYLACFILLIMVSPVLYWNANHHWISILYLLSFHSQTQGHTTIIRCFLQLLFALFVNYSVFLVLTVLGWIKYQSAKNKSDEPNTVLEFINTVLLVALVFWCIAILFGGASRTIYLTPLGINIALVAGYTITQYHYERYFRIFYPLFLLFSIISIIANSWPIATYLKKGVTYRVISNALNLPDLIKKELPIVTGSYTSAAELSFFMPNEQVYTLPCGDSNQYQYWSESFLKDLFNKKIETISFIDFSEAKLCAERFFNKCQIVATLHSYKIIPIIHKSTKPVNLYVYECSLLRDNVSQLH